LRTGFNQRITGKPAPRLQLGANSCFTGNCDQIAGAAAAECRDQLWQQAGGKRLGASIEFNICLHYLHGADIIAPSGVGPASLRPRLQIRM
jgi:hypothetical protein